MIRMRRRFEASVALAGIVSLLGAFPVGAADHGDAPAIAHDRGADLGDCFLFLDPRDNDFLVAAMTTQGFIAAGENVNFSIFDPLIRYQFNFETTGDARRDQRLNVEFSPRVSTMTAQTATVRGTRANFTAPATNPSIAPVANPAVVTTDPASGIGFFAGPRDDPFFFDIPAFARFIASVAAGSPDATRFNRGRDSFAGYNVMAIALRIPVSRFSSAANDTVGLECVSLRQTQRSSPSGLPAVSGAFGRIDRGGNPAVNVALIPFPRKNIHNVFTPIDDASGAFDANILATLNFLGTAQATQQAILDLVARRGDYVRVDLTVPNTGGGGGRNAAAAFPNGRRLGDDTIDTLLSLVSNGALVDGDNVDASDVPLLNTFPFMAPPHQPRNSGRDDNTRN